METKMLISFMIFGVVMFFQSCMPVELRTNNMSNYAPFIDMASLSLSPLHGIYNFKLDIEENKDNIKVRVIDFNDDRLTVAWYVRHVDNPKMKAISIQYKDLDENHGAEFTFELKKSYLSCGLNQITFLVSDRGIDERGDMEKPYPNPAVEDSENVKIDLQNWFIELGCK